MRPLVLILILVATSGAGLVIASRLVERAAEARFPPLGQMVEAGQTRLHVVEQGRRDGRPVVLIHGANGAFGDWMPIAAMLDSAYRVIAIDRPGHGYSDRSGPGPWSPTEQAEALRAAIRKLGVERPILVGFSWGGTVATAYALDDPDEVGGVVTVGAPYNDWSTGVNIAYRLPTWPVIGPIFSYAVAPLAGRLLGDAWAAPAFRPEPPPASFAGSPWPLAVRSATYLANAEDISTLSDFLARQKMRYARIRTPFIIIHGDQDEVVSPRIHAETVARIIPGAELAIERGAGHMIPYTRPAVITAAVARLAEAAGK